MLFRLVPLALEHQLWPYQSCVPYPLQPDYHTKSLQILLLLDVVQQRLLPHVVAPSYDYSMVLYQF